MKQKYFFSLPLLFILTISFGPANLFSQTAAAQPRREDSFSVKGRITRIDPATKTLYLRNEAGLELTYHVDDSTQIEVPDTEPTWAATPDPQGFLSRFAVNDSVEIGYRYNENYEKIALSIRKELPNPALPAPKS